MTHNNDKYPIDFVIDFESIGMQPDGVVLDFAAIPFTAEDFTVTKTGMVPKDIDTLRENAFYRKFRIDMQQDRIIDDSVVKWWEKQDKGVQSILEDSSIDTDLQEFFTSFNNWFVEAGGDFWKSRVWSRGNEFDMGMMTDIWRKVTGMRDTYNSIPFAFWNVRDIRTAVERSMGVRGMATCPIPKGTFPNFRKHNSIDDCIMAVLHLVYSELYSYGEIEIPWDNYDENSYSKKRK